MRTRSAPTQGWRQVEGRPFWFCCAADGGIAGSGRLFLLATRELGRTIAEREPVAGGVSRLSGRILSADRKNPGSFSATALSWAGPRPECATSIPARDSRDQILEHYTGVGEVLAIHALDRTFGLLHRQLRVKRGSLLSLDDVKNNDTIFVGSPAENLTLREIPSTEDFVFRPLESGPRKGDLAIVNVHPQAGRGRILGWQPFAGQPD